MKIPFEGEQQVEGKSAKLDDKGELFPLFSRRKLSGSSGCRAGKILLNLRVEVSIKTLIEINVNSKFRPRLGVQKAASEESSEIYSLFAIIRHLFTSPSSLPAPHPRRLRLAKE